MNMKYFKHSQTNEVYAFNSDGSQDAFITSEMILMNEQEVDQHLNPEKYLSDAEKKTLFEQRLVPLERRQFKLAAFEDGFLKSLEDGIESIEDPKQKGRISIEYIESDKFYRTSEALIFMLKDLVNMTDDQINEFWIKAQAL